MANSHGDEPPVDGDDGIDLSGEDPGVVVDGLDLTGEIPIGGPEVGLPPIEISFGPPISG